MSLALPRGELELDAFLPYRLAISSRGVSRALGRRYEAQFGLTIPDWRCLAALGAAEGLTASAVGERTSLDKVQTSRALARLVKRGAVLRAAHPGDRRAASLALTAAGRTLYGEVAAAALAFERELTQALGLSEKRSLDRVLLKLDRAVAQLES